MSSAKKIMSLSIFKRISDVLYGMTREYKGAVVSTAHYAYNGNQDGPCVNTNARDARTQVDYWMHAATYTEEEIVRIFWLIIERT
jgi:hypothetical protein